MHSEGWIFDVEILARLIRDRRGTSLPQPRDVVYEVPLSRWRDVGGSKLGLLASMIALSQVARVWWRYLR